jgi:hypothetical protein
VKAFVLATVASGALLAGLVAPAAQAALNFDPQIEFATSPIAVGSSGAGTFSFSNDGTLAADIERIVLEPSCRLPGEQPPCTNREPGIFSISSGTGATGTVCEGITFSVSTGVAPGDAPFIGSLQFTPSDTIPTMAPTDTCGINFTYTALAIPTFDTQPGEAGQDTDQNAEVRADSGGGPVGFGPGTDFTAVTPGPPATIPIPTPTPTPTPPQAKKKCKKAKKRSAVAAKKCKKKK